jgi:hypothetical protein
MTSRLDRSWGKAALVAMKTRAWPAVMGVNTYNADGVAAQDYLGVEGIYYRLGDHELEKRLTVRLELVRAKPKGGRARMLPRRRAMLN